MFHNLYLTLTHSPDHLAFEDFPDLKGAPPGLSLILMAEKVTLCPDPYWPPTVLTSATKLPGLARGKVGLENIHRHRP